MQRRLTNAVIAASKKGVSVHKSSNWEGLHRARCNTMRCLVAVVGVAISTPETGLRAVDALAINVQLRSPRALLELAAADLQKRSLRSPIAFTDCSDKHGIGYHLIHQSAEINRRFKSNDWRIWAIDGLAPWFGSRWPRSFWALRYRCARSCRSTQPGKNIDRA